jgi:CshA-type fibril repeat protein
MKKIYFLILLITSLTFISCSDDDSDYEDVLPVATNDVANYETLVSVTVNILLNDTSGDAIVPTTVSLVGGSDTDANGTLDKLVISNEGTWTVDTTTGSIKFTPNMDFTGTPTLVKYTAKDAQGNISDRKSVV